MDKEYLVDQLTIALSAFHDWEGTVEKREDCPSSEVVVRMPCYAAFFSIIESSKNLEQSHATAESEISRLKAMKDSKLPRDLELVLILADDQPPDPILVRRIVDDRYICRKFVLWPDGQHVDEVLADLPFWPPSDLLGGEPISVRTGVQDAMKGYDPSFITDLVRYSPGAERVFEKIREGKYKLTSKPSAGELVPVPRAAPSALTKLESLEITDFRGIRCLRSEDMSLAGDVVFIYGPNGVGKTSIADAVEWVISGQVGRLARGLSRSGKVGPDPIVNVFSDKGEAQVICHLSDRESIRRFKSGRSTGRQIGSRRVPDDRSVIDYVVGTKAPSREARLRIDRLRDLFWSSHMLSQHDIRRFLEETEPDKRFDILTNMIGAEEFVRFREKLVAVLRRIRTEVGLKAEQKKSFEREIEGVSTRCRALQKEYEMMSQKVTVGKNPEDLASEILQGLKNCHCIIDEAAVKRVITSPQSGELGGCEPPQGWPIPITY